MDPFNKTIIALLAPKFDALKQIQALFVQGRADAIPSAGGAVSAPSGPTSPSSPDTDKGQGAKIFDVDNTGDDFATGTSQGFGVSVLQQSGSEDFTSVSGARRPPKPFIVGIIPPDVTVNFVPVDRTDAQLADITSGGSVSASGTGTATADTTGVKAASGLPDSFYKSLAAVAKAIGASPADLLLVLYSESGLRPDNDNHVDGDKNKPVQARGLNQITPVATKVAGMSMEYWQNEYSKLSAEEQLPYVQRYFKGCYKGPYLNPTQLYIVNFAPAYVAKAADPNAVLYPKYLDPPANTQINNNWKQNQGINPNGDITAGDMAKLVTRNITNGGYLAHLARMEAVVGKDAANAHPAGASGAGVTGGGGGLGGGGLGTAATEAGKVVGGIMEVGNITDLEGADPLNQQGRNIRISDVRAAVVKRQVLELNSQIAAANSIPALLMLINPSDFSRSYEQQVDTPKARRGPVVHMWLEKPLSISCKGTTAAQYALDANGDGGLTHMHRLHSLSYVNLMSLAMLYRNNGHLYTHAASGDTKNWGIPVISMSVYIYYDGHVYIGSFDDFSISDDAEKPFSLNYSWKFTARYDVDVTSVGDEIISALAVAGAGSSAPFPTSYTLGLPPPEPGEVEADIPKPDPQAFPEAPPDTNVDPNKAIA